MNIFELKQSVFFIFLFIMTSVAFAGNSEEIYNQNCLLCHGEDAKGAMPSVPDLKENASWVRKSSTELLRLIKKGIESPGSSMAMPPKGGNDNLTDEQLLKSIEYMRTLITATQN